MFSKILVQFYILTTSTDIIKAILVAIKWFFFTNFIFLMTNHVEQLFMCLLGIQRCSFGRDLFKTFVQKRTLSGIPWWSGLFGFFVIDLLYMPGKFFLCVYISTYLWNFRYIFRKFRYACISDTFISKIFLLIYLYKVFSPNPWLTSFNVFRWVSIYHIFMFSTSVPSLINHHLLQGYIVFHVFC